MEAVKSLEAAAKNSPAYGAWNVQKATMDPSRTLPGPVVSETAGATDPITGNTGKWVLCRKGVGGGHSTD